MITNVKLHTDGGYGCEDKDKKLEQLEVTQVTTAVRVCRFVACQNNQKR